MSWERCAGKKQIQSRRIAAPAALNKTSVEAANKAKKQENVSVSSSLPAQIAPEIEDEAQRVQKVLKKSILRDYVTCFVAE